MTSACDEECAAQLAVIATLNAALVRALSVENGYQLHTCMEVLIPLFLSFVSYHGRAIHFLPSQSEHTLDALVSAIAASEETLSHALEYADVNAGVRAQACDTCRQKQPTNNSEYVSHSS